MIQKLRTPVILLVPMLIAFQAEAQIVSIRTAPVSVGEQFSVYPSQLMGMGGGLALQDLELDPFANPATGARIHGILLAGSPTLYSIPDANGFGRTLPVTAFVGRSNMFVGGSVAMQELESAFAQRFPLTPGVTSSDRFAHNAYTWGMIGRRWPEQRLSVAFSGSYANLDKVHAVDLLYPQSESIEQGGHINDLRVGLLKELSDDRYLEAVLVRNKVDMEHTVTYVDRIWLPAERTFGTSAPRRERNLDRTATWGAHALYAGPTSDTRWRWATALTANVKSHPKIPNYEFMSVPRDPGNSYAFSFAVGVAKQDSLSRLALDFAYEPVWTNTWAEAAEPIVTERGVTIPQGGMTIENEFVFSTYTLHAGWSRRWNELGIQLGLGWRNVQYFLDQYNAITDQPRQQDENWVEITPTWGLTFDFSNVAFRYFGHRRGGGFRFPTPATMDVAVPDAGPDIVAAPSGPLSMDVTRVISHQIGVSIPIGGRPTGVASR
jgi:hypothetical protein